MSSTPATRLDVINLQVLFIYLNLYIITLEIDRVLTIQEQLDQMLQKRQARETGICPVRRELYGQAFGEPSFYNFKLILN